MDSLWERVRARYMNRAGAAFDELMAWEEKHGEGRLLEIEEVIERLRVPITQALMEAVLDLRRAAEMRSAAPVCAECGKAMRYKGQKRKRLVTTAGEVDWRRGYYHCQECKTKLFPPGSEVGDRAGCMERGCSQGGMSPSSADAL